MHHVVGLVVACAAALAVTGLARAAAQTAIVDVVSSPPDLVTGQDVVVRVRGDGLNPIGFASNATLPTPFRQDEHGDWFGRIGLTDHLIPGDNIISVLPNVADPLREVTLTITVHGQDEPLFDGPRPGPAACRNEMFGLPPPRDETCATPRSVNYIYRSADGTWAPLRLLSARPSDIDRTVTSTGEQAPMIVRIESGVINRAPYAVAFLHDPASGPAPSPGAISPSAWNGSLIYGAGAAFRIGNPVAGRVGFFDLSPVDEPASPCPVALIESGYAIAAAADVTGPPINDIVAAETLLRVKERFIKR